MKIFFFMLIMGVCVACYGTGVFEGKRPEQTVAQTPQQVYQLISSMPTPKLFKEWTFGDFYVDVERHPDKRVVWVLKERGVVRQRFSVLLEPRDDGKETRIVTEYEVPELTPYEKAQTKFDQLQVQRMPSYMGMARAQLEESVWSAVERRPYNEKVASLMIAAQMQADPQALQNDISAIAAQVHSASPSR